MSDIIVIGSLPQDSKGYAIPQKWALFDLDWTLIRPETGTYFEKGVDWVWLNDISRLKDFIDYGYKVGIVTNQRPWGSYSRPNFNYSEKQSLDDVIQRLTEVHQELNKRLGADIPIMAGLNNPEYQKPGLGWFQHIEFLPGSFMVGDSAGRPGDFSDWDLRFAQSAGLDFYYPEDAFNTEHED